MAVNHKDWHGLVRTCHKLLSALASDLVSLTDKFISDDLCDSCLERYLLGLIRQVSGINVNSDPLVFLKHADNHRNCQSGPKLPHSFPPFPDFGGHPTFQRNEINEASTSHGSASNSDAPDSSDANLLPPVSRAIQSSPLSEATDQSTEESLIDFDEASLSPNLDQLDEGGGGAIEQPSETTDQSTLEYIADLNQAPHSRLDQPDEGGGGGGAIKQLSENADEYQLAGRSSVHLPDSQTEFESTGGKKPSYLVLNNNDDEGDARGSGDDDYNDGDSTSDVNYYHPYKIKLKRIPSTMRWENQVQPEQQPPPPKKLRSIDNVDGEEDWPSADGRINATESVIVGDESRLPSRSDSVYSGISSLGSCEFLNEGEDVIHADDIIAEDQDEPESFQLLSVDESSVQRSSSEASISEDQSSISSRGCSSADGDDDVDHSPTPDRKSFMKALDLAPVRVKSLTRRRRGVKVTGVILPTRTRSRVYKTISLASVPSYTPDSTIDLFMENYLFGDGQCRPCSVALTRVFPCYLCPSYFHRVAEYRDHVFGSHSARSRGRSRSRKK